MGVLLQDVERGQSGVWHVTHLLFADDLAVINTSQERLQSQTRVPEHRASAALLVSSRCGWAEGNVQCSYILRCLSLWGDLCQTHSKVLGPPSHSKICVLISTSASRPVGKLFAWFQVDRQSVKSARTMLKHARKTTQCAALVGRHNLKAPACALHFVNGTGPSLARHARRWWSPDAVALSCGHILQAGAYPRRGL
jgi:hypothetical protein